MSAHRKDVGCRAIADRFGLGPFLFLLLLIALGGYIGLTASPASAQIPKGNITIELETVASGLTAPLGVTHAGDGSGRPD